MSSDIDLSSSKTTLDTGHCESEPLTSGHRGRLGSGTYIKTPPIKDGMPV